MKLKNIITASWLCCGAVAALMTLTACSDDDPIGTLGEATLDKTYLSIPETGGDATLTINATADWSFDRVHTVKKESTELPDWLTASVLAGSAGETRITFHADATTGGRETELRISVGDNKQFIKVRQGDLTASAAKCSEIMTGIEGKNYRVTGRVTKIAGMEYGNWFLDDGSFDFSATAKNVDGLYIYGTLDKKGKSGKVNPIDGADGWGFEVGDQITVEGPLTIYNGQYELVNVTVVKIVKSLIQILSPEPTVELEGGQVEVKIAYKGSGAYYTIDDAAKSWVSYEGVSFKGGTKTIFDQNPADTAIYKFNVAPNNQDKRTGVISFSSSSGKNSSQIDFTVTQKGVAFPPSGQGTAADPFNVTAALNYTRSLGANTESEGNVYVKGKISSIKYTYSAQYGTATYNISCDGKENDVFTVYSSYFFENEQWEEGQTQIAVGDEVIVCGKVIDYNGNTPEFASKKSWLVSINGKTSEGGEAPAGTQDNPFTVAEAFAFIDGGGTDDVFVEGIISKIVYTFSAEYGTATFWISEDGTFNDDLTKDFEAYSVYYFGNKPWAEGNTQVAVGDKVVLQGKLTKYVKNDTATYETSSKKAWIYSLNGKTE